jgi:hypothetical protein
MELRDLIVTPILIILLYVVGYIVRPYVTNEINRVYFIPALTVRIVGALAVGFIYQFYYSGGDTFNYHTHGSRHVWEAFVDSPSKGLKLLFSDGSDESTIYKYSSRIPFFRDRSSYNIIRLASFFDLFTFSSYSATAICFATLSFIGAWMLFLTFYDAHPHLHKWISIATLFVPSVFFWGSGLLKDTVSLAFLGAATYYFRQLFIQRKVKVLNLILLVLSLYMIFSIKKYILLCYLPAVFLMAYSHVLISIKNAVLKIIAFPIILTIMLASAYYALIQVGKDDAKYSIEQLGNTAKITAYDIAFQTGRDAGSTYSLGALDGSFGNLLSLAPQAVNVSLFRPYLWEVRNPLMFISALESAVLLILTLLVLLKGARYLSRALFDRDVLFCAVFSVAFAFAVGVSTYNFGSLSRYKIPLLPFYLLALIIVYDYSNKRRNVSVLELTE